MMRISFTQIYVELDTDLQLPGNMLQLLAREVNCLNKTIPALQEKFAGADFTLAFIITAARQQEVVEVKGPTWVRRKNRVEFAVHVPFREFQIFEDKIEYVLGQLAQGVIATFHRYRTDSARIQDAFDKVVGVVRDNPSLYRLRMDTLPTRRD